MFAGARVTQRTGRRRRCEQSTPCADPCRPEVHTGVDDFATRPRHSFQRDSRQARCRNFDTSPYKYQTVQTVAMPRSLPAVCQLAAALVDGDAMNGSVKWKERGTKPLPFDVVDLMEQARAFSKTQYDYVVYDTEGNPEPDDVKHYAESCDLRLFPLCRKAPRAMAFFSLSTCWKSTASPISACCLTA